MPSHRGGMLLPCATARLMLWGRCKGEAWITDFSEVRLWHGHLRPKEMRAQVCLELALNGQKAVQASLFKELCAYSSDASGGWMTFINHR